MYVCVCVWVRIWWGLQAPWWPCHNLLRVIFLQAMPRLRHLPQWWLARLKEYYQENSFAYITGLSANQSALSKHSNPNRAPGLGRLMSNTLGRGPSNPWTPPSPPSHHTLGSHWLALIGCIKHSTDFLIILHMVTHGLVPRAADTRTSAALDWSPGFQITTRTQGGKRVSGCDCNDCRKYVTRTGMVSGVHDTRVFCPFLLVVCSMWGPEEPDQT